MKKITLFVTMLLVSATGVFAQATEPVKVEDNPNAPEISFDKMVHDYGTVAYGGDGVCTFKFN